MVKRWRSDVAAVLAGGFAGAVVLGRGGRLAMAARAMAIGLGAAMLPVAWATSTVGRQTAATAPVALLPILGISFALFLAFGITAHVLAGLCNGQRSIHPAVRPEATPNEGRNSSQDG